MARYAYARTKPGETAPHDGKVIMHVLRVGLSGGAGRRGQRAAGLGSLYKSLQYREPDMTERGRLTP